MYKLYIFLILTVTIQYACVRFLQSYLSSRSICWKARNRIYTPALLRFLWLQDLRSLLPRVLLLFDTSTGLYQYQSIFKHFLSFPCFTVSNGFFNVWSMYISQFSSLYIWNKTSMQNIASLVPMAFLKPNCVWLIIFSHCMDSLMDNFEKYFQ